MDIREHYRPVVVGANATVAFTSKDIGGFLAKTDGTVTVVDSAGVTIVNALPVLGGVYYPMPFYIGPKGGTITTASGASGTLAG